jgi:hypothetical protein
MVFAQMEAPAAAVLPGPLAHREMAGTVIAGLKRFMK